MPKNPAPTPIDFHNNDLYLNSKIKLAGSTYSRCFNLFCTSKWISSVTSSFDNELAFLPESSSSDDESSVPLSCDIFNADIYDSDNYGRLFFAAIALNANKVFLSLFFIKNFGVSTKYSNSTSTNTVNAKTMNIMTRHESPNCSINSNPMVD